MTEHGGVIAGGGPTGLMLAAELALAAVDVAIVEGAPVKTSSPLLLSRGCGTSGTPTLSPAAGDGLEAQSWRDRQALVARRRDQGEPLTPRRGDVEAHRPEAEPARVAPADRVLAADGYRERKRSRDCSERQRRAALRPGTAAVTEGVSGAPGARPCASPDVAVVVAWRGVCCDAVMPGRRAASRRSPHRGRGAGRTGRGRSVLWRVAGCRSSFRRL
jgi:hypothetical protein